MCLDFVRLGWSGTCRRGDGRSDKGTYDAEELQHLVEHLRSMPRETEWLEFKHNNADPQEIGEYLPRSRTGRPLHRQGQAYILWGIEDGTHELVGTTFQPRRQRSATKNWKTGSCGC